MPTERFYFYKVQKQAKGIWGARGYLWEGGWGSDWGDFWAASDNLIPDLGGGYMGMFTGS